MLEGPYVESTPPSYKGHRYPVEVISHCVWLYHRFPLSFLEVEELMLERGIVVGPRRPGYAGREGSDARRVGRAPLLRME
ncbi:hypothetical protein [Streptomyces griseoloalbus]|uniref:hypothetical protein n=1 Tax=Streptomyces griseoloalbus TaxID=67303 RepID=UPI003F540C92